MPLPVAQLPPGEQGLAPEQRGVLEREAAGLYRRLAQRYRRLKDPEARQLARERMRFVLRGLLARCGDMRPGQGAVSLVRKLPWDQSPVAAPEASALRHGGQPTHVLFNNRAYAIDAEPLMLGTQSGGGKSIDLQQDMPGVSRQHCALQQENGQCIIRDHSRYDTFLNGHRNDGSAVLQVGDLVRLGTPGYELRLITTETEDGT